MSDQRENPKVKAPKQVAAGFPAVWSSVKALARNPGLLRGAKALGAVNQKAGFDCPGCAWPDPDDRRSMVEFCENGAKAVADEATRKKLTRAFFREWSIDELKKQPEHWLNAQGRFIEPLVLRPGSRHYEPIAWDEAFALVAAELKALASPDRAVFYTSGRTSNEAAFLYQLLVRRLGTNNLPDCSNLCHESSGVALKETIGSGKGTVTLGDFDRADLILVVGQNPGTNHPRMLSTLESAKLNGARIVSINPLREAALLRFKHPQHPGRMLGRGTEITDHFVQIRINGDVAFFKAVAKLVIERERARPGTVIDREFIDAYTDGFDAYVENLDREDLDALVQAAGVNRADVERLAAAYAESKSVIACWAMGLTQHENAVANIQEVVNLMLLRGNVGRPGAGLCPVRGHSNVQGDRTMGIWEKPPEDFLARLGAEFGFEPPRRHGFHVVESIQAMARGDVDVFMSMGGNFLSASPDTDETARALARCRLTVQVSTKLNRSHLETGKTALILPCLGRTEIDRQSRGPQYVTVEDSMGVVHASRGTLAPPSPELLSEPVIVARLGHALFGADDSVPWLSFTETYDRIRERIERVIPGFDRFNERMENEQSFYLPHPARDERRFLTATGKARFTCHAVPRLELGPGELVMMTIRSHDQYNTTVYGLDDRYRGIYRGRRVVLINPADIASQGFKEGDVVTITSDYDGERRSVDGFRLVAYDIPVGSVATYFPEANPLVPLGRTAAKSGTPISKSVIVRLEA